MKTGYCPRDIQPAVYNNIAKTKTTWCLLAESNWRYCISSRC